MLNYSSEMGQLVAGNLTRAATDTYAVHVGGYEVLYIFLIMFVLLLTYIKTEEEIAVGLVAVIIGLIRFTDPLLFELPGILKNFLTIVLVLGIALTLYRLIAKK